jgi:hypothetical protein
VSDNVVPIRGAALPLMEPSEPDPEVVGALERLLDEAKAGSLRGIAAVTMNEGELYHRVTAGAVVGFMFVGLLYGLATELTVETFEQEDD